MTRTQTIENTEVYVVRSHKRSNEIVRLTLAEAVNELAKVMPASLYSSRLEILAALCQYRTMETRDDLYEVTVGPKKYD